MHRIQFWIQATSFVFLLVLVACVSQQPAPPLSVTASPQLALESSATADSPTPELEAVDEKEAEKLVEEGIRLLEQGNTDAAVEDFDLVLHSFPDHLVALRHRALALDKLGYSEKALADFDKAIELAGEDAELHYQKADALVVAGQREQARQEYTRAHQLGFGVAALMGRGAAFFNDERFEEALKDYQAAVKAEPELAQAHYQMGRTLNKLDRKKEAQAAFLKARRLNSGRRRIMGDPPNKP